jgi:DNA-binding MarR family transcriptional regulator
MPRSRSKAGADPLVLDLERYVPALLVFLANKLTSGASTLLRRHFGVGTTEWRIMALLAIEPWITANRVCKVIGFDKAAVSRSVALLQGKALVLGRPHASDSRSQEFALSKSGWRLHDRIIRLSLAREERLLSGLKPAEREQLIVLLNRLLAKIPHMNGPIEIPPDRGR